MMRLNHNPVRRKMGGANHNQHYKPDLVLCRCCVAACNVATRQEARTLEELQLQHIERGRSVAYFGFMQQQAAAQAAAKLAACDPLLQAIEQQLAERDVWEVAARVRQQADEVGQLTAEHMIMLHWSERFEGYQQAAAQRFASLV